MAILQVNVRPAARDRRVLRSQWWEKKPTCVASTDPAHLIRANPVSTSNPVIEANSPAHSSMEAQSQSNHLHQVPVPDANPASSQQITWTLMPAVTVGRALVSAAQRLHESACENPRLDAQVLLAHVLGQERSWLFAHHDYQLTKAEADQYAELVARRASYEPVAYLVGRKEFYGLDFDVDQRVLIPRPETELLVDLALAQIHNRTDRKVTVADVGTGSGAIAVTLGVHAPDAHIYGLDVSQGALAVAQQNQQRLAPVADITFLQSDLLAALPEPVDLIVANLPYVTAEEYQDLAPDIRNYEPRLALEAGSKGLDIIERLLKQVRHHLKPDGAVLLEIGSHQGDAVASLAKTMKPKPSYVGLRRDYSGHIRMVTLEF